MIGPYSNFPLKTYQVRVFEPTRFGFWRLPSFSPLPSAVSWYLPSSRTPPHLFESSQQFNGWSNLSCFLGNLECQYEWSYGSLLVCPLIQTSFCDAWELSRGGPPKSRDVREPRVGSFFQLDATRSIYLRSQGSFNRHISRCLSIS